MKISTERVTIEAAGELDVGAAAEVDFTLSTLFRIPMIASASLPTPAEGNEGMIAYDTTNNKLVVSTGSAWQTVTSS